MYPLDVKKIAYEELLQSNCFILYSRRLQCCPSRTHLELAPRPRTSPAVVCPVAQRVAFRRSFPTPWEDRGVR